ncbi:MAG: 4Fe-4S dicluster domain-containing protein [Ruminococcaceae bacterium]|nr:4Fe-4S dicluster domain-containing protein [Oscillospiraceae bacterium]
MIKIDFCGNMVSRLGFGAMRLPVKEDQTINFEKAEALFDYAMANGVNYFDTAFGYHNGKSAEFVGKCLSKYDRSSYYVANKMPAWNLKAPGDLHTIFEKQLSDLKTDYIDYYLLHSMTPDTWKTFKAMGAYEFCLDKKKKGIIKNLGFSFHGTPELLKELLDFAEWDFVQIQFNYLDYYSANAKLEYDMITARGIPVIVMEPVRGGKLADISPRARAEIDKVSPDTSSAAMALRFAGSFENVSVILSGMSNEAQVKENIELFSSELSLGEKEMTALYNAANEMRRIETIPCTACSYCTEVCPMGIDIPFIFDAYNKYLETKDMGEFKNAYAEKCSEGKRAPDCIKCEACVAKCPQSISIPDILALMPKLDK